jgi:hypothetical protein
MQTLTIRDKLALIYTSAGSLRNAAMFTGLSRYRVTRLLKPFELGGYPPDAPQFLDPELNAAVNAAFQIHKNVCRQTARAHNLPFIASVPIYIERLQLTTLDQKTGKRLPKFDNRGRPVLGDRVAALHTHWISDALREHWIAAVQQTRFFYQISVRSEINLAVYFDRTEKQFSRQKSRRTPEQWKNREQFRRRIQLGQQKGYVFTGYQSLGYRFAPGHIAAEIARQLRTKHEPASINLADQYLLQVDTWNNEKTDKPKTKRNQKRDKRNR